jgi:hypothetical protein
VNLDDLKPSITSMQPDEVLKVILATRASRRISKKPVVEKKPSKARVKKTPPVLNVSTLTNEQAALLLALLDPDSSM